MKTWFLNHVLGLSLLVLQLGLPGPLGAGTPSNNSTDPVTAGLRYSAAADELRTAENNATPTSHSSETLSPSQRNLLLRHAAETHAAAAAAAGSSGTEHTHSITEASRGSLETTNPLATEPLTANFITTTEASSRSSTSRSTSTSTSTSSSTSTSTSTSTSSRSSTNSSSISTGSTISTRSSSRSSTNSSNTISTGRSSRSSTISTGMSNTSSSRSSTSSSSTISTDRSNSSSTISTSRSNSSSSSSTSSSSTISTGRSNSSSTIGTGRSSRSSTSSSSTVSTGRSNSSSTISTDRSNSSSTISTISSSRSSTSSSSTISTDRSNSSSTISTISTGRSSRSSTSSSSTISTGRSNSSTSSSSSRSRDWEDFTNTDQMPGFSHVMSEEDRTWVFTEEASMHQDSSDTTLRMRDATASMSHTDTLTDSTYTTTIGRAGERTLLSVTSSSSNSTSSAFTEDSNPHQPPSTWGIPSKPAETEDYTHSAPSTRINERETTDQHMTDLFKGGSVGTETGSSVEYRGTQSFTGQPNATEHQRTSTSEGTSDSTPPLRVTEPSTDRSEASVSSTPPFTSPAGGPTNISGTEHGLGSSSGASTVFSSGDHSTSTQGGTEGLPSKTTEKSVDLGLTAVPSTVSSSTSEVNQSLTDVPPLVTNVFLTTSPVTVTERSQITEEDPTKSTAFSTAITTPTTTSTMAITTPPPAPTSSSVLTSITASSPPQSSASATVPYSSSPTAASTLAAQPTQHVPPSHTQGPVTRMANPTDVTPPQTEASTGALRVTTAHRQFITTTYSHSTPTKSTEALHTTGKQTDRGPTEPVVTTTPPDVQRTSAPLPSPKLLRNPCVSNPCNNGGMCVSNKAGEVSCSCQQGWTGQTCSQDIDECKQDPCPAGSRCINTGGSFRCECPLGFDLEDGRTCTRAKTFLGTFNGNKLPHNPDIQREIIKLLSVSLSVLRGYRCSTLTKKEGDGVRIMAVNMFSISADVMTSEVNNSIQTSLSNCNSSLAHCHVVLQYKLTYRVESLCTAQKTQCDAERSSCTDSGGTAYCQCREGYYKHNPDDLSCLECGDGYKLENGTCVPCMFGFGGFNCGNFYKLIAVVVSPAGGALLLILIIALIVTCCKRDKNDINKIIFKSGDLQMSPYADFPKNNRISMEWGRETIEMQENGSTKNLLQMTDIYYSPALRNSDLERNGLYPFPGLPGSRHSCIYPAQWNPSFISDDSRRRDYF